MTVAKNPPASLRILVAVLAMSLSACAAPSRSSSSEGSGEKGAVLLRTYFVALKTDVEMGEAHPPLDRLVFAGYLPAGGQDIRSQLGLLAKRLTVPSLGFQFSDTALWGPGKDATLRMGFGEVIEVRVTDFARTGDGTMTAGFSFRFGKREALRQILPVRSGEPLLFCGHLDASLPILSVFTLEIEMFAADRRKELENFLGRGERDRREFAPPPPKQRDREPYIPGVGDVTLPTLVSSEKAVYPDAARPGRMDGQVIVEITVDREGKPANPRILTSSSPIFEPAALEAAKTYRYSPATRQGQPVSVTMNLVMIFKYTAMEGP